MRGRFEVRTESQLDVVDVTDRVEDVLAGDADGEWTISVGHRTAGVVVDEAESRLLADVESFLGDLVPDDGWEHDRLDGNTVTSLRT